MTGFLITTLTPTFTVPIYIYIAIRGCGYYIYGGCNTTRLLDKDKIPCPSIHCTKTVRFLLAYYCTYVYVHTLSISLKFFTLSGYLQATCARSLTHCPISQGWASRFSFVMFVWAMVGWVTLPFSSFYFLKASVLCTCISMYMYLYL